MASCVSWFLHGVSSPAQRPSGHGVARGTREGHQARCQHITHTEQHKTSTHKPRRSNPPQTSPPPAPPRPPCIANTGHLPGLMICTMAPLSRRTKSAKKARVTSAAARAGACRFRTSSSPSTCTKAEGPDERCAVC